MANIAVMVNGIPGNMGRQVAEVVLSRGWSLVPFSLTGPDVSQEFEMVADQKIALLKPSMRDEAIEQIKQEWPQLIAVDYTHPTAVIGNVEFYLRHQIPFVMGTTGGDRARLKELLIDASISSVVAPNMAKQIVGFQAMIEWAAQEFPGLFNGWNLHVVESHQQGKADTSGTAKAVVSSMQKMGLSFNLEEIQMVRTPEAQKAFGIPEEHLRGHAYHTYSIDSADGAVHFEFQHNVCGRRIYAEGSCDAVAFLAKKIEAETAPRLYDMSAVLRAGVMN